MNKVLEVYMKKISLIITIILFYCMIIGYGVIGIPLVYSKDPLIGGLLVILLLIGLAFWTKISRRLIKEIRNKK